MTYEVDINTKTGHIVIGDAYDEEADTVPARQSRKFEDFDNLDKQLLREKFFELNT
jgi:hypothetical protein